MANIKAVATHAGVSIATVSHVLNGTKRVSTELEERVRDSIRALGYRADPIASRMKSARSMTIGFIVSSIDSVFFPQVIAGIQSVCESRNYTVLFFPSNFSAKKEKKYIDILVSNRVDGILIDSVVPDADKDYFARLSTLKNQSKCIPVVSLERNLTGHGLSSITIDHNASAQLATRYLYQCGCHDVAHLAGPAGLPWAEERCAGYESIARAQSPKFTKSMIAHGDFTPLSGYAETKKLLLNGISFDGLFAANDLMALGAIKALQEHQLQVPADVKVMGFDNIFISSLTAPSLSSINVPKKRLGEDAANLLFEMIQEESVPVACHELPVTLIERHSTNQAHVNNWELYID